MARVKFDPSAATRGLKKKINKATAKRALRDDIGEFLTERVKFQARRGRPLNDKGKFPKLEESTVKKRRRFKGKKNPAFSPAKSNLTITGQLLDAISFRRLRSGIFELFIEDSERSDSSLTNEKIDEFLTDGIRNKDGKLKKYIAFTTKGLKKDKKIPRRIKQLLLRFLRKQLKS